MSCATKKRVINYGLDMDNRGTVDDIPDIDTVIDQKPAAPAENYIRSLSGPIKAKIIHKAFKKSSKALNHCYSYINADKKAKKVSDLGANGTKLFGPRTASGHYGVDTGGNIDGNIAVSFLINADGSVTEQRIISSDFDNPRFEHCVQNLVSHFSFPEDSSQTKVHGYELRFSYEIDYVPND